MKPPTSLTRLSLLAAATVLAQTAAAQDADLHPRGLFETPQPGMTAPFPRTPSTAETLKEKFHLSVGASARYDDNVYRSSSNEESDVIVSISPTLSFVSAQAGSAENTFAISYSPSYSMYFNDSDNNNLGHSLSLRLNKEMPKTSLGFNLNYSKSSGSNRFASGIIDHGSLSAGLSVSHRLTGKTSLNLGLSYNFDDFGNSALFDNNSYGVNLGLRYQFTGKISLGPYVNYRFTDLSDGGGSLDQENLGYGISGSYQATGKTSFTGSIGSSTNGFSGVGSGSNESALTWAIGVNHRLTGKTSIRASFYRDYKASYSFEDAGYLATGISLSATHAVSDRLSMYATLAYENDDYFRATNSSYSLESDYYMLTLGGRYRLQNGMSVGASVSYSRNDDSQPLNDFDALMFSINTSYTFW